MSEYIISICKPDSNGPIKNMGKNLSILEYPFSLTNSKPKILKGNRYFQISVPESYIEIYNMLPAFAAGSRLLGLQMLNGKHIDFAIDMLCDAIMNIHTRWKNAWIGKSENLFDGTPENARMALEQLLELCHLAINMFSNEWRTSEGGIDMGGFEIYISKSLI